LFVGCGKMLKHCSDSFFPDRLRVFYDLKQNWSASSRRSSSVLKKFPLIPGQVPRV
jgi:hypothetical protein